MKLIDRISNSSLQNLVKNGVLSSMDLVILNKTDLIVEDKAVSVAAPVQSIKAKPRLRPGRTAKRVVRDRKRILKQVGFKIKQEVRRAISALSASKSQVVQTFLGRRLGAERHLAFQGIKELEALWGGVNKANSLDREWIIDWQYAKAKLEGLYRALKFAGIELAY